MGGGGVVASPELSLLVAAVGMGLDASTGASAEETAVARVAALLDAGVDRGRFVELVDWHRVAPLVLAALKRCGERAAADDLSAELMGRVRVNSMRALLQASELARLQSLLSDAGVDCLFFKGPVLAMHAYGELAWRHAGDLDVLVDPEAVETAAEVIRQAGYRRVVPSFDMSPRQTRAFRANYADYEYVHPDHGLVLELHWRLFANAALLQRSRGQLIARGDRVVVGAADTPLIDAPDLLLYLCVHGAKHAWFRLFWLADVHVLLSRRNGDEQLRLLERARVLGVERMLLQAALLCRRFFSTSIDERLQAAAERDPVVAALVMTALDAIVLGAQHWVVTGADSLAAAWEKYRYLARLRTGLPYVRSVLMAGRVSVDDWQVLPLPDALFLLYTPLRLPLWFVRHRRVRRP